MRYNSNDLSRSIKLLEGMWQGDLNDLVSSNLSIDEFESKVDEKAIVVGFFVHDVDAADDLNRFIQKSTVDILYSEVSPAPDQRGYYIVFAEFLNNSKLIDNIIELVEEVTALTNVEEWTADVYGYDKRAIKVSEDNLKAALQRAEIADEKHLVKKNHDREVELTDRVKQLKNKLAKAQDKLRESCLYSVDIRHGNIILETRNQRMEFELQYVGQIAGIDNEPFSVDFDALKECRSLAFALGEGWDVAKQGRSFVLHSMNDDIIVKLRPAE